MSELDEKQVAILAAWKAGLTVTGFSGSDFGMIHAMQNAVTGIHTSNIAESVFDNEFDNAGYELADGVRLVARELAAHQMGYPYLDDCEKVMKEKADE